MVAAADLRSCDLCGALVAPGAEAPPPGDPVVCDTCLKTRRVIVEPREPALSRVEGPEGARGGGRRVIRFDCPHCRRRLQSKAIARRTEIRCPRCDRPFAVLPGGGVEPLAAVAAPAPAGAATPDAGAAPETAPGTASGAFRAVKAPGTPPATAAPGPRPPAPAPAPAAGHRRPASSSGERPAAALKAPVIPRRPSGERPVPASRDVTPASALGAAAMAAALTAPAAPATTPASGLAPAALAAGERAAPTSARLGAPPAAAGPAGPVRPALALFLATLVALLPPAIGGIAALSATRGRGFAVREPVGPALERAGARFRAGVDALAARVRGPASPEEAPAPESPAGTPPPGEPPSIEPPAPPGDAPPSPASPDPETPPEGSPPG